MTIIKIQGDFVRPKFPKPRLVTESGLLCVYVHKQYMKYLAFHLLLKPLIRRNYKLRAAGVLPDQWYWADKLACKWGYSVAL